MRLKPTMTSGIAAALYASKWLASLLHLSDRERDRECMNWEEEVLESANLRILCEVWISVHQSWVTTGWVPSGLRSKLFGILG